MVITMSRLGDMEAAGAGPPAEGEHLRELPVFNLAFNPRELAHLRERDKRTGTSTAIFLWTGDVRLLLAIIKYCEDVLNVGHDTHYGDVRCILLIEDSVRFYSSYLPMLYTEVLEQTQSLMVEGINLSHRLLRLRARPKILLATTYEEAWEYYKDYKDSLLGVISDGRFPWKRCDRGRCGGRVHQAGQVRRPAHAGRAAVDQQGPGSDSRRKSAPVSSTSTPASC